MLSEYLDTLIANVLRECAVRPLARRCMKYDVFSVFGMFMPIYMYIYSYMYMLHEWIMQSSMGGRGEGST
jgi:hypothetical protein